MKLAGLLLAPLLYGQPDRFGLPACAGELADRAFYFLCYDAVLKVASWTSHELRPHRLLKAASRPRYFRQDTTARNADYRASGYSRGHLVPAADLAWSDEAIRSTFVLSNAVPQRQSVNGGEWRRLENAVREIAARSDAVYVFTGPVFARAAIERIGPGQVAVPTHIFKVVLAVTGERKTMYAAVVPNASTYGDFTTTVAEVQRLTGLDFFSALEDEEEHRLESAREPIIR